MTVARNPKAFMKKVDADKNGQIDFAEFKNSFIGDSVRADLRQKNELKLRNAFNEFDKDKNGYLTMREIVDLMNYLRIPEDQTKRFMERADKDNSNTLTFEEFCIVVRPKQK
jgi:Ca2+-binding EF-hand superfamily protein